MTEGITQQEFQRMFDTTVKRRMGMGDSPMHAVQNACREMNITLPMEVEQNIVNVLKMALSRTPAVVAQEKLLSTRIRQLMKEGQSTAQAVRNAQSDTNIHLGSDGERALIEVLESERERVSGMRIEVVSKEEFKEVMGEQKCIPYHLNGKDGWSCCGCGQHNPKREDACTMCSHARCDRFNA